MNDPVLVPGHGSGSLEQLLAEEFPRMLMVQTTSACNSSCVFCPHRLYRDRLPQGRMDDALFHHWKDEKVTTEDVLGKAQRPDDLAKRIVDAKRGIEQQGAGQEDDFYSDMEG